jgi:SAM-dependent methyltransferase
MLQPHEYDGSYFDGKLHRMAHNAGYSTYARWHSNGGEIWRDRAIEIVERFDLVGKKVLDLGCAKGFLVEDFCDLGVDAIGLDCSSYALFECDLDSTDKAACIRRPDLAARFILGDARNDLTQFADAQFDLVISTRVLECFSDGELAVVVEQLNRIGKAQLHSLDIWDQHERISQFYNIKPLGHWIEHFPWPKGTHILPRYDLAKAVKV